MENLPDTPINDQWNDSIDVTPESNQPIGDNIPSTMEQPLNERENTIRDPEIVAECVSLLNGGPPTSQQEIVTPMTTTGTATSTTAPTGSPWRLYQYLLPHQLAQQAWKKGCL